VIGCIINLKSLSMNLCVHIKVVNINVVSVRIMMV
jgi:hypothetical protein